MQGETLHFSIIPPLVHFLSSPKENGTKRKVRKRPELRGRLSDFPNHSMNSLRSNSISYFVAQIAFRNQRLNNDSENPTSSKDLFVRNVFEDLSEETCSTKCGARLCRFACEECFRVGLRYDERRRLTTSVVGGASGRHGEPQRGKGSRAIPKP